MNFCKDCEHASGEYAGVNCLRDWTNPVTGNGIHIKMEEARASEWACGAEGNGFVAKERRVTCPMCQKLIKLSESCPYLTCESCWASINRCNVGDIVDVPGLGKLVLIRIDHDIVYRNGPTYPATFTFKRVIP